MQKPAGDSSAYKNKYKALVLSIRLPINLWLVSKTDIKYIEFPLDCKRYYFQLTNLYLK